MTVLNFPANPSVGEQYNANGIIYTWNGSAWTASDANDLDDRFVQVNGDTMTGNLDVPSVNGGHAGPNNVIINGGMTVAQRGTTLSSRSANSTVEVCDRWIQRLNLVSAQFSISQDDSTPPGFSKSLQWACTTQVGSLGSGEFAYIAQRIEGQNAQVFGKGTTSPKSFAVSFWVRSSVTGTYAFRMIDQKNNRMVGRNYTVDVANTWERKSFVIAGESTNAELDNNNTSQLELRWFLAVGSERLGGNVPETWRDPVNADSGAGMTVNLTDNTNNRFFITGIQLTPSDTETLAFQHEDYATTLRKCQRYYQTIVGALLQANRTSFTEQRNFQAPRTVTMRAAPTETFVDVTTNGTMSGIQVYGNSGGWGAAGVPSASNTVTALDINADAEL